MNARVGVESAHDIADRAGLPGWWIQVGNSLASAVPIHQRRPHDDRAHARLRGNSYGRFRLRANLQLPPRNEAVGLGEAIGRPFPLRGLRTYAGPAGEDEGFLTAAHGLQKPLHDALLFV